MKDFNHFLYAPSSYISDFASEAGLSACDVVLELPDCRLTITPAIEAADKVTAVHGSDVR